MKKLILLLTVCLLMGCQIRAVKDPPAILAEKLYTFEYEGCEYVVYENGFSGGVTHKGNCSNPIHGGRK